MSADSDLVVFRRIPAGLSRPDVRAFASRLRDEVAGGRPFCCLVTGDAELRRLNRDFTGGDYATDVLSFPAESAPAGGSLGDLAISAGRARAQALEHGHSVEQEVGILMLHGLLHLLGMDHASDRGRMARAERKWRSRLGLPEGLIERARA
jgi:probable rRNA maturation factor